jgi:uncharacterized protein YjgD (DUF1641 family)
MSLITNADLVAMMQAMMARLDAIEAKLEAQSREAQGALQLANRPEVARVVDLVADNSDTIAVLLQLLAQSPGTLELVTHTVANFLAQRDEHGRTIEEQLTTLMALAKRLTQPAVLEQVQQAMDLFEQSPDLMSLGVDYVQGLLQQVVELEGDLPSRFEAGVELLELATRPELTDMAREGLKLATKPEFAALAREGMALADGRTDTLRTLMVVAGEALDRIEASELDLAELTRDGFELLELAANPENIVLARRGLQLVAKLDGTAVTMLELSDELVTDIQTPEFHFEDRARTGIALLTKLSAPDTLASIQELLDSGMMDPAVLQLLTRVGGALQKSAAKPIQPKGMFGALGALQSARTQKVLGFALDFSEQLGEAFEAPKAITDGA